MEHTPEPWRYEPDTRTIRSEPQNYWLATMDSWDGAVDNAANAKLMAASPDLLEALEECADLLERSDPPKGGWTERTAKAARAAIEAAS